MCVLIDCLMNVCIGCVMEERKDVNRQSVCGHSYSWCPFELILQHGSYNGMSKHIHALYAKSHFARRQDKRDTLYFIC